MRCSPSYRERELLKKYEQTLREEAAKIGNNNFDDTGWLHAKLPVRHGGNGLRSLPAYLFSRVACRSLISDVLNNTNGHRSEVEFVAVTEAWVEKDLQLPSNPEFKRNWDESMCKAFNSQLEKTLNQHKLASLVSSSQNCYGPWLIYLPNSARGGLLDDESFRIAISLRLGLRFMLAAQLSLRSSNRRSWQTSVILQIKCWTYS